MWIVTVNDTDQCEHESCPAPDAYSLVSTGALRDGKYQVFFETREQARNTKRKLQRWYPRLDYQIWKITPVR